MKNLRFGIFGQVVIVAFSAAAAAYVLDANDWDVLRQGLITAISIFSASILLRLARGIPFTDLAWYKDSRELETFTDAYQLGVRQMVRALAASIAALFLLVFIVKIIGFADAQLAGVPYTGWIDNAISSFLAALIAYAFVRMIFIIRNDLSLIRIQTRMMRETYTRKKDDEAKQERADRDKALGRSGGDDARYGSEGPHPSAKTLQ